MPLTAVLSLGFFLTCLSALLPFSHDVLHGQELYKFNGKSVSSQSLSPKIRQSIYDAENVRFKTILSIIDNKILDDHINKLAAKQKKTPEQVRDALFTPKPPSEKEMKKFYNDQKSSIPYDYKKVRDKIKELMISQKKFELRDELVSSLKKKGKFKYLLKEPTPQVFTIDTKGYASKGKSTSKVQIVEFADYQCPHCKHAHSVFKKVLSKIGRKVNYVYIDYPVNRSGISKELAKMGYCVRQKSEKDYWKFHDYVFENQDKITHGSALDFAKRAKVYNKSFDACTKAPATQAFIAKSLSLGESVGVTGTPSVFVNGQRTSLAEADDFIDEMKKLL